MVNDVNRAFVPESSKQTAYPCGVQQFFAKDDDGCSSCGNEDTKIGGTASVSGRFFASPASGSSGMAGGRLTLAAAMGGDWQAPPAVLPVSAGRFTRRSGVLRSRHHFWFLVAGPVAQDVRRRARPVRLATDKTYRRIWFSRLERLPYFLSFLPKAKLLPASFTWEPSGVTAALTALSFLGFLTSRLLRT